MEWEKLCEIAIEKFGYHKTFFTMDNENKIEVLGKTTPNGTYVFTQSGECECEEFMFAVNRTPSQMYSIITGLE